jgi:REP element-mobilizing transposase RayT
MARPLRIQYAGAFYHIMCRGNKGNAIFVDSADRNKFLHMCAESLDIYEVTLFAFVLMQNHFHLILQTQRPNLSEFMRRFNICYTGWFNYHHGTYGHLYQGRYKSLLIDADNYLLTLSRYVHFNPLRLRKSQTKNFQSTWHALQQYKWSTLPGYIKASKAIDFVSYDMILKMVGGRKSYQRFIIDGLKKDIENPLDDVKHQVILGNDSFVQSIRNSHTDKGSPREQPVYRRIKKEPVAPDTIIDFVAEHLGLSRKSLVRRNHNGVARGIVSELLYRFSALTLREIGNILGVDYSSVYKSRQRFKKMMLEREQIARIYNEIQKKIKIEMSNV